MYKDIAIYYHNNLMELLKEKSNHVKDYIIKRKFDMKTLKRFAIGYANGKIPLYDYLINLGYKKEDILKSDVVVQNEKGKIYDRYFSRLMFPILDVKDKIIAFEESFR